MTARGTVWGKWDLHVHTPASIVQNYGGDTPESWDRFLDELEALPAEFAVVGINDYWFLDGYRRVLAARAAGRLANLDAIFPVLELRLDQFGGTTTHLSRANLHIIFDPTIGVDVIQEQFISAMSANFKLTPEAVGGVWSGVPSKSGMESLGASIKQSVSAELAVTLGSDTKCGFDNLVVSLDDVTKALGKPFFRNRALLALGKTEWADIKWQEGSVASKKHLVNSAKLLFTAFEDPATWSTQRHRLIDQGVNSNLLDCSDAHTWADDTDRNTRIGNCATWIRATPTFGGLLHAVAEFDSRVYVGSQPADLVRLAVSPERVIDRIDVNPLESVEGSIFDYGVPLNPGLVAVIGHKGTGKSALLDCIARAANSSRGQDFAFLNRDRFLSPKNGAAGKYQALLTWCNGRVAATSLNAIFDPATPESVEYLPQALIERICNSDPNSEHGAAFEAELKRVIFHHISRTERQSQNTLDSLLELRMKAISVDINALGERIYLEVEKLVGLNAKRAELKVDDITGQLSVLRASRASVEDDLAAAQAQLTAAEQAQVVPDAALEFDRARLAEFDGQLAEARTRDDRDAQLSADERRRVDEIDAVVAEVAVLKGRAEGLEAQLSTLLPGEGPFVELVVHNDSVNDGRARLVADLQLRQAGIDGRAAETAALLAQRVAVAGRLEVADSAREALRRTVEQLQERLRQLVGASDDPTTIEGLTFQLSVAEGLPADVDTSRGILVALCRDMHGHLTRRLEVIRDLYRPAATFVQSDHLAQQAGIEFKADLAISSTWARLPGALDGRRTAELLAFLASSRESAVADSGADVVALVGTVLAKLVGGGGEPTRGLSESFRGNVDIPRVLADFVTLSWLEPRFGLTGNGSPLSQLSPGQRGLILLLFYLLVDRSDIPLLLDQPEENLDNDAIRHLLVPALKQARSRRQILAVTHNANLAIVGDADQIVVCSKNDGAFRLACGALSGHDTGEITIKVLEGDRDAFRNRGEKYETVVAAE